LLQLLMLEVGICQMGLALTEEKHKLINLVNL